MAAAPRFALPHGLPMRSLVAFSITGLLSALPILGGSLTLGPSDLLAPLSPQRASDWSPPASPTAGLNGFKPGEPKDWRSLNQQVTPGSHHHGANKDTAPPKTSGEDSP